MKGQINIIETKQVKPLSAISSKQRNIEVMKPVVENLLLCNRQFAKINASTVVNLNYVDVFNSDGYHSNVFISGETHTVTRYFLPRVIIGLQTIKSHGMLKKQTISVETLKSMYRQKWSIGSYLSSNRNLPKLNKIDCGNIYYLSRSGSLTTVYFTDGTESNFYNTLTFFEEKLTSNATFIRIKNDCIINLKYAEYIKFNDKPKSGKIKIGPFLLSVSRRMLVNVKEKIQQLSFL